MKDSHVDEKLITVNTFQNSDLREFGSCVPGLNLQVMQIEPGEFCGESILIDLEGLMLAKRKSNLKYFSYGEMPGYIIFSFPLIPDRLYFSSKITNMDSNQIVINESGGTVGDKNLEQLFVAVKIEALKPV